jgi:hypothetical protein
MSQPANLAFPLDTTVLRRHDSVAHLSLLLLAVVVVVVVITIKVGAASCCSSLSVLVLVLAHATQLANKRANTCVRAA